MPNVLEAAGNGLLRIFGAGRNRVCFTHVDNYAHALIIAEQALFKGSPALGQFYIVTDGASHPVKDGFAVFWETIDEPIIAMGFTPLASKFRLPVWLLNPVAHVCDWVGWAIGRTLKLNPFNVRVLTMHRWFRITAAEKDLNFQPIVPFYEVCKAMLFCINAF